MSEGPVMCANCAACKVSWMKRPERGEGVEERRVRCAAGQWMNPSGKSHRTYPYYTVLNRTTDECSKYEPMTDDDCEDPQADLSAYLNDLGDNLPGGRQFRQAAHA